jgi:hypothetical protein
MEYRKIDAWPPAVQAADVSGRENGVSVEKEEKSWSTRESSSPETGPSINFKFKPLVRFVNLQVSNTLSPKFGFQIVIKLQIWHCELADFKLCSIFSFVIDFKPVFQSVSDQCKFKY